MSPLLEPTNQTSATQSGALSGIRVLDLSRILAGPWASQTLGDLGAEVIKVERPATGDDTRSWGPPFLMNREGVATTDAAYYLCTNRNKKSIAVDIASSKGQDIVRELARQSDVLIENFKVGSLKQYGLDYDNVRSINPKLIYCSITGFGHTGPYSRRAGYDFLIQGMGGLMSITGHPDGEPGAGPMKVGVALTDILAGLYASTSILAALQARHHTGEGQHIDLALLDVGIACLANQSMNYLHGQKTPQRMGNAHPNTVPYQDFPTADGYMILAIGNDSQFAKFCIAAGHPTLANDERYAENKARLSNRVELVTLIRNITREKTTSEWISLLEQAGVPCGPINTVAEVFADQQVKARGMQMQMEHPVAGPIPLVASPIRLSGTPVQYRQAPPTLGEHTREVMKNYLQMNEENIKQLLEQGVIG